MPLLKGPIESKHRRMKKYKRDLSRFTGLFPMLTDVFNRLFFETSGEVRSQIPGKRSVKNHFDILKSNSLDDQLTHQMNLKNIDSQLVDYFIHGGEISKM